jgi:hypothetical protein
MLKKLILLFALSFSSATAYGEFIPLATQLSTKGFEEIARRNGVVVYKHRDSDIIRLGAEGDLPASPEEVQRALLDYRQQVGIIKRLSESRVLNRGNDWLNVYQRLNLPVIDDRDFTLGVRWGKQREIIWITYQVVKRGGPSPRRGIVRVSRHEGSWQLQPIAGGKATHARFMVMVDMGGILPKWLARSGSGKEVPELFTAIRTILKNNPPRSSTWASKSL